MTAVAAWEEAKAKGNAAYGERKLIEAIEHFTHVRKSTPSIRK